VWDLPDAPLWRAFATIGPVMLALWLDQRWGEPPLKWHPVVWMGRYLETVGRRIAPEVGNPVNSGWTGFLKGALGWWVGAAAVLAAAWLCTVLVDAWGRLSHPAVAALWMGLLLKPLFAWRMLRDEVQAVEDALAQSLDAGRTRLSWLVSRDVTQLTEAQVRESAIETLAENLNDSVVAPLFWFALLGLPGAALYRFANTADAMWGYRGERNGRLWEWAGKWAAWADDGLSWVPARLTAWGICMASPVRWSAVAQQARLTPSPNSGWPMAAMALCLGVRLGKPGAYTLAADSPEPVAADTLAALQWAQKTLFRLLGVGFVAMVVIACMSSGFGL
jgi:adenosylcobinamide-phosphate synthase